MKAVIQRVSEATVTAEGATIGKIAAGLVVLLAVGHNDTEKDADFLCDKILNLRIFQDKAGKMNRSLMGVKGELLVVSQFTLMADCRKGRRPSFVNAAPPDTAYRLYCCFIEKAKSRGVITQTGSFGAAMHLSLVNDGPVTMIIDTGT